MSRFYTTYNIPNHEYFAVQYNTVQIKPPRGCIRKHKWVYQYSLCCLKAAFVVSSFIVYPMSKVKGRGCCFLHTQMPKLWKWRYTPALRCHNQPKDFRDSSDRIIRRELRRGKHQTKYWKVKIGNRVCGVAANPACGQLDRGNGISLVPVRA